MYAFAVDMVGWEHREEFDAKLESGPADQGGATAGPAKKRQQAQAQRDLMARMGGGARG